MVKKGMYCILRRTLEKIFLRVSGFDMHSQCYSNENTLGAMETYCTISLIGMLMMRSSNVRTSTMHPVRALPSGILAV